MSIDVTEASIAALRYALETGDATSVGLVEAYLARIDVYDRSGPRLNSVVVFNPDALDEAQAADERRQTGTVLGPLDGIPYTAKNSFLVKGLTAAAGSPAFAALRAIRDAFAIERLRAAGSICLGLTTMPPMAAGGMQRGLYGRAESPYNPEFLTAAFASGSSNGSGTATASSFAAFGLGEETWSSGRAPASNNSLCAYTPSRGLISLRGNWPLVPTMDVVVPHTRTMADLFEVLDVIVVDDDEVRGDFWRAQPWVTLPSASSIRPESFRSLEPAGPDQARAVLAGLRFGVPRMYLGTDAEAGSGGTIGGPTGRRIEPRQSSLHLFAQVCAALESAGATIVDVDFPAVTNYEGDRAGAPTIGTRGLVSTAFLAREILDLSAWAWEDFLNANGDPDLSSLAAVDGQQIFPPPPGALPDRYDGFDDDLPAYPDFVREHPHGEFTEIPEIESGTRGLEETRRIDFDQWLERRDLAAVIFPAVADVGAADMDVNADSADAGWRNGVWVANGNLAIRHLGIPTVTVPMGLMSDIRMPVGLTLAGAAYSDVELLRIAAAFEHLNPLRVPPPLTPPLNPPLTPPCALTP